jgi:DNA-binding PadR family transcriptional regulator
MDPFHQEILELISAHDGEYSWYQIDRSLSQFSPNCVKYAPSMRGLMGVLRELTDEGLIVDAAGHHQSQPVYSITLEGREMLTALTSSSEARLQKQG